MILKPLFSWFRNGQWRGVDRIKEDAGTEEEPRVRTRVSFSLAAHCHREVCAIEISSQRICCWLMSLATQRHSRESESYKPRQCGAEHICHKGTVLKIADFASLHSLPVTRRSSICDQISSLLLAESPLEMARREADLAMRRLNSVLGSPHYVAPEVLQDSDQAVTGPRPTCAQALFSMLCLQVIYRLQRSSTVRALKSQFLGTQTKPHSRSCCQQIARPMCQRRHGTRCHRCSRSYWISRVVFSPAFFFGSKGADCTDA